MSRQRTAPCSIRRDRILLACGLFLFIATLTTHGKYSDTGDEPHYLMVARSLVRDHDLDLANNYAAPDSLSDAGTHVRRAPNGSLQSVHDIGLPVLISPVYALAERVAASVPEADLRRLKMPRDSVEYSIVSMTMLAGVCVAFAWFAAAISQITTHGRSLAIAGLFALTPPVLTQSFLIFPETVALVVMCGVVWWLLTPAPRRWTSWALAVALGYLPWCHRKFSPLAIACVVVMLWQRRDLVSAWSTRMRIGLAAAVAIPYAAFYLWSWQTWGSLGGPQLLAGMPLSFRGIPLGLTGLLFDRQYGLLADAPIYLAVLAFWVRSAPPRRWWLLMVASVVLPMSAYVEWWAGFSPVARYLVPVLPLCFVALADSLRAPAMRVAVGLLVVVQSIFTAFAWHHPRSLWPWIDGGNPLLRDLGPAGEAYARFLPTVTTSSTSHIVLVLSTFAVFNCGLIWLSRSPTMSKPVNQSRTK